jgi:hypothetical protein
MLAVGELRSQRRDLRPLAATTAKEPIKVTEFILGLDSAEK